MKKKAPIVGIQREKLILALETHDIVSGINLAMKVRRVSLTLDYATDPFPRLFMEMPGVERERIMLLDQRKHCCYISPPSNRELFFAFNDIHRRLHKLGGRLSLTGDRPKQGPMRVRLQAYIDGTNKVGLTLMETFKGKSKVDTSFELPDGSVP